MGKKRVLLIVSLGLAALAVMAYLAYTWLGPAGDRPTLMCFHADL